MQFEHQLQLTQSRENVERGLQSLEFLRDDLVRAKGIIDTQDQEVTTWLEENEAKVGVCFWTPCCRTILKVSVCMCFSFNPNTGMYGSRHDLGGRRWTFEAVRAQLTPLSLSLSFILADLAKWLWPWTYYCRLIKTLAEHNAIEDALYFMDRALSNDEIELSSFLKEVRKLSRKQFMCQALIQKINETQQQLAAPTYHSSARS